MLPQMIVDELNKGRAARSKPPIGEGFEPGQWDFADFMTLRSLLFMPKGHASGSIMDRGQMSVQHLYTILGVDANSGAFLGQNWALIMNSLEKELLISPECIVKDARFTASNHLSFLKESISCFNGCIVKFIDQEKEVLVKKENRALCEQMARFLEGINTEEFEIEAYVQCRQKIYEAVQEALSSDASATHVEKSGDSDTSAASAASASSEPPDSVMPAHGVGEESVASSVPAASAEPEASTTNSADVLPRGIVDKLNEGRAARSKPPIGEGFEPAQFDSHDFAILVDAVTENFGPDDARTTAWVTPGLHTLLGVDATSGVCVGPNLGSMVNSIEKELLTKLAGRTDYDSVLLEAKSSLNSLNNIILIFILNNKAALIKPENEALCGQIEIFLSSMRGREGRHLEIYNEVRASVRQALKQDSAPDSVVPTVVLDANISNNSADRPPNTTLAMPTEATGWKKALQVFGSRLKWIFTAEYLLPSRAPTNLADEENEPRRPLTEEAGASTGWIFAGRLALGIASVFLFPLVLVGVGISLVISPEDALQGESVEQQQVAAGVTPLPPQQAAEPQPQPQPRKRPQAPKVEGLKISSIAPGSIAAKANLQPGDTILRVNGQPCTVERYKDAIAPGQLAVEFDIQRGEKTIFVALTRQDNEKFGIGTLKPAPAQPESVTRPASTPKL